MLFAPAAPIEPPPMPRREIVRPAEPFPGQSVELQEADWKFTLYLPDGYQPPADGKVAMTAHFHGAVWFAIQEHRRRDLREPLLALYAGEGSSVYKRPFDDPHRFGRWLRMVEGELARRFGGPAPNVSRVDISSFSAGYGAVRELLKSDDYVKLIRRVVLADSLYAGFAEGSKDRPDPNNMAPFFRFAERAARGEKEFVVTYSLVKTPTYASSSQCAASIVDAVGGRLSEVSDGPATQDPEYPLRWRFDKGGLHVWGYGGEDAMAHMTHARHIADIWRAVDSK